MEMNTKIINHEFEYHAPRTLEDALGLLRKPGAVALAGGTDLINRLKQNSAQPTDVVYLGYLEELKKTEPAGGSGMRFGAMVSMTEIEKIPGLRSDYGCLYEAIHSVGGQQIRNTATVAGNIANASPAADSPVALIALGARCELGRLGDDGKVVRRQVPVEEMFSGPGKTILEQGELILDIVLPPPAALSACAFQRNTRVKLDVAKASVAVWLRMEGESCAEIRIAAGSVGPVPLRGKTVEDALGGKILDKEVIQKAAELIEKDIRPITDVRSTDTYRQRVMKVLVRDAVLSAWEQSKKDDTMGAKAK